MSRQKTNRSIIDIETTPIASENNISEFAIQSEENTRVIDLIPNLEAIRISQDFTTMGGGATKRLALNHRKPGSSTFFRTHPTYEIKVGCLELKDQSSDVYLVSPGVNQAVSDIAGNCYSVRLLVPWVNRQGEVSLWALKLPSNDGKSNDWFDSALEAANDAKVSWLRIAANMRQGRYDIFEAETQGASPIWPELAFVEMVRMAFKNKVIDNLDHPLIKSIQGR